MTESLGRLAPKYQVTLRMEASLMDQVMVVAVARGLSRQLAMEILIEAGLSALGYEAGKALRPQVIAESLPSRAKVDTVRDLVATGQVTSAASLVTKPSTKDHPFKEGKSAFKCEICGVNRGSH